MTPEPLCHGQGHLLGMRSTEADIVAGLAAGADDYLSKPISAKQLLARMQSVVRRYQTHPDYQSPHELRVGDLILELDSHEVTKASQPISVARAEFRLLYMLMLNAGCVVPYAHLIDYALGYSGETSPATLKTHLSHVRTKLGLPRKGPGSISAVAGEGYCLAAS